QRVAATSCESYFRHLSRRSNSASLPSPVRRIIDDHNLNHQGASVQEGETMSEPMMETLVQRLGCLEKENLAFKRTNIILIASVAAALLMGQSQCNLSKTGVSQLGKLIEAQEFVVRDANGKERAKLAENGLTFSDGNGRERVHLRVGELSTELVFSIEGRL